MLFLILPDTAIMEIKLVATLGVILTGWELSMFFIHQYSKLKDETIKFNNILLSFGFLFLFGYSGLLFIKIPELFIEDLILVSNIQKIGFILVFTSLFFFWFQLRGPHFSKFINQNLLKMLLLKSFIPIIYAIIFPLNSTTFLLFAGFISIDIICVIIFQNNVIRNSVPSIKKRFYLLYLGEFFAGFSILLGSSRSSFLTNIFKVNQSLLDGLYFLGIFFMFLGEIITYFVILGFPHILELKWKENLIQLYIINQKDNNALYIHDFNVLAREYDKDTTDNGENSEEMQRTLFSGGIIGIDSITSAITNTEGEKMNKIRQGDLMILLDYNSKTTNVNIIYALIVKEDIASVKFFLKSLKIQFESFYRQFLSNLEDIKGNPIDLFSSFDIVLKNILG